MRNLFREVVVAGSLAVLLASPAAADVLQPRTDMIVLDADGSGVTKVALRVDLSGLRRGRGLTIQSAVLEWVIPEMPGERKAVFKAHRLAGPWGILGPDALDVADALHSDPEATWEVYPQDHARLGKRLLKIDLSRFSQELVDSRDTEMSFVVATKDVSREALSQRLPNARFTIRYGFLGDLAPLFPSRRD